MTFSFYLDGDTVVIEEGSTEIPSESLREAGIKNVVIPDSVRLIGEYSLSENNFGGVRIILPDSVITIDKYAFYMSQLTEIDIGESVESIGYGAFSYSNGTSDIPLRNNLEEISLPDSLLSIEGYAFAYNDLSEVTIPDGVRHIGEAAFMLNQLTGIRLPQGLTRIERSAFSNNQLTSVVIPDSVTSIAKYAFSNNQLTSIVIPNGVVLIDSYAFSNNQLTSVVIPDSVTTIGDKAFRNNTLISVELPVQFADGIPYGSFDALTKFTIRNEQPSDIYSSKLDFNENAPIGSAIAEIGTIDSDANDDHKYSLVTGNGDIDNHLFAIEGNSLQILESTDFETKNSYYIRLKTTDIGGLVFEKSFTLSVNDVNESPTALAVSLSTFNENIDGGSAVATLSSSDVDAGDSHTYSLVSGVGSIDNSAFTIDGNQLKIVGPPDFETKSSYSIRLQTKDSGGLTFEKAFILSVNDVNEAPSELTIPESGFDENIAGGVAVASLGSADVDSGDTHTYSLVDGEGDADNSAFTIDGNQLKIVGSPDFETKSSYSIRLQTKDSGGLTFEKAFTLSVNDLDEIPVIQSLDDVSTQTQVATSKFQEPIVLQRQSIDFLIVGTIGNDDLVGTSNSEVLAGADGKDILTGGIGADAFLFQEIDGFGGKKADVITDFYPKDGDFIFVDQEVFGLDEEIRLKSSSSKKKVKKAAKSSIDFIYYKKKGLLYFNENGKEKGWGDGGLFAKLQGAPELGADDFTIV